MIITTGSKIIDDQGNNYVLDEVLGEGGFGSVYKAHRENDGVEFAVKIIQNTFGDQTAFLSFKKETNLSMLIESENVIKYLYIHNGEEHPEYPPYIIMEYTDGGTLRDLINNQNGEQFDIETLKSIFIQLATGMKCVSEHLVHRDIKPDNILNFNGVLKITDFGLSKIAGDNTKSMTFKNGGTYYYMAPEAWNNDKNTIQMDIYSMGIVFYELATLSFPYRLPSSFDAFSMKNMHLFEAVINPSSVNKSLPPELCSLIVRMLEKSTLKRFNNWDEILEILNVKAIPADSVSSFVDLAINNRTQKDIQIQREISEAERAKSEKGFVIDLAYSQFNNSVLLPIREFVEQYNAKCSSSNKIVISETVPKYPQHKFCSVLILDSGKKVTIYGEVLFKENYKRQVKSIFDDYPRTVNYQPQCENKDILLWGQITDTIGFGFNLLLLKNDNDMYGEWKILYNEVNGLTRTNRPSPFGFKLEELPSEIVHLHAMHIYNMSLHPYSANSLLKFIAERV